MNNKYFSGIMKKSTLFTCLLLVVIGACKKESLSSSSDNTTNTDTKFANIAVTNNFSWSNDRNLTFNFDGAPESAYPAILKVSGSDGSIIYQKLQKGDEDFSTSFKVPANYETLDVQFGATKKTFSVKSGIITMNLN